MSINLLRLFISVFLFTYNFALTNSASIAGIVKDSGTKEPLVGANVYITGTSLGTATTDEGEYTISNINPGTYTLKTSYIGYES